MNSLFIGLAIPFSMLVSFAVLHAMGYTLNIIVLFSLILSLGMLVDNAIVIVDNIYRHHADGEEPGRGRDRRHGRGRLAGDDLDADDGGAFFPMLFWPGIMGEFMSYLPADAHRDAHRFALCRPGHQPRPLRLVHEGGPEAAARGERARVTPSCAGTSGCSPSRSTGQDLDRRRFCLADRDHRDLREVRQGRRVLPRDRVDPRADHRQGPARHLAGDHRPGDAARRGSREGQRER